VLFWICHSLTCKQIAQELVVSERTVYFHLGNIYQKLGLNERSSAQRRLMLGNLYCPLLDQEVSDPDRDCAKLRQPDREPVPEPSAETLALVKLDEQRSLIPIQRAIVPVQTKPQGKPPPEIIVVRPPAQALPQQRRSFWPVVISLGVGAVLMFFILRGLGWLPGANQPPSAAPTWTPQPTETRAVAQQSVATATPTKTSVPTATPSPTPTVEKITGSIRADIVNVRAGPGAVYDLVSQANRDARVEVIGANPARDWWEVRLPGGGTGWIQKDNLYVSGCNDCVPVSRVPATPTLPRVVMALPFEDRFDPRPRTEWRPQSGTWRVVDGWYTADPADTWSVTLAGDEGWTDYALDVDVRFYDWNFLVRVIVRASGGAYLVLQTNCCGTDWILVGDGQERKLAHSSAAGLSGGSGWRQNHLKVEVKGDIYIAYSDGIKLLQVQDTTLRNGRVGLATQYPFDTTTRFGNFSVTALR
jgi:uncharacterized protein YraI